MRHNRSNCCSYRQSQEKLKRNFQLKIEALIVLARLLSLLALILSYYHERL